MASAESRVTAEAATVRRVCIPSGEHLMMFGDSVTRYQWILLAYALKHGVEYNRSLTVRSAVSDHGTFNELLHYEPTWRNWTSYFAGTNEILGPNSGCDCYRDDSCCKWWQRAKGACTTVRGMPPETAPFWCHEVLLG